MCTIGVAPIAVGSYKRVCLWVILSLSSTALAGSFLIVDVHFLSVNIGIVELLPTALILSNPTSFL